MRLNFVCLIFVARDDYENILTAKISRFTVYRDIYENKHCLSHCFTFTGTLKCITSETTSVACHLQAMHEPPLWHKKRPGCMVNLYNYADT